MTLPARDADVVRLVGRLGQTSSAHIRSLLFSGLSPTTFDRAVSRLLTGRYLHRVGRRPSGDIIGASPYVYQLGVKGWAFCDMPGAYQRSSSINEHTLGIADVFVLLIEAERAGLMKLLGFELEQAVGDGRADAWLEIGLVERGQKFQHFLEIDLGSERPIRIEEKCAVYWRAYTGSEAEHWPYVVFVVPDERRRREVERVIRNLPAEQQELFRVFLLRELTTRLLES